MHKIMLAAVALAALAVPAVPAAAQSFDARAEARAMASAQARANVHFSQRDFRHHRGFHDSWRDHRRFHRDLRRDHRQFHRDSFDPRDHRRFHRDAWRDHRRFHRDRRGFHHRRGHPSFGFDPRFDSRFHFGFGFARTCRSWWWDGWVWRCRW